MNDAKRGARAADEAAQPQGALLSNDEWNELLATVAERLAEVENIPYPGVKEKVFDLLQAIDGVHREPLRRLVHLFKEGVLEKVVTDPAIHTLMELYDLLPAGSPREAQPLPSEKAHWRARLTPAAPAQTGNNPQPHWMPVLQDVAELARGQCKTVAVEDRDLLLCRVNDDLFALAACCAQGDESLAGATVNGYMLACPNHRGCYYDVRQGKRVGASGALVCYPTRVDESGRVLVGFGMPFSPNLPSF